MSLQVYNEVWGVVRPRSNLLVTVGRVSCLGPHLVSVHGCKALLRKGQLNRHTRYRPATTTRNTATQRSCHSVD